MEDCDLVESQVRELIGRKIEDVSWAPVLGSCFRISLGERFKKWEPSLERWKISEIERFYDYEFILRTDECSWRINRGTEIIALWNDHLWMERDDFRSSIRRLEGCCVEDIQVVSPFFDLSISFSDSIEMKIFCDCCREPDDYMHDYSLTTRNSRLDVGPAGKVRLVEYDWLDLSSPLAGDA